MAKSSLDVYGAEGEQKVLLIDPEKLKLVTDKGHPLYDERVHLPINEEMVASIMAHGYIHNVRIRKNPENGDIEVSAGRQRVKNGREANRRLREAGKEIRLVPCSPAKGADAAELFGVSVAENEIRTPDTPLGRAEKARRMVELGRSDEQVMVALGLKTVQTVRSMLSLLDATAAVKKAVEEEAITVSNAYKLAKLEPALQRERLAQMLSEAPRSGKKAKAGEGHRAAEIAGGEAKPRVRSTKEILAFRERLVSGDTAPILGVIDWVLGKGEAPVLARASQVAIDAAAAVNADTSIPITASTSLPTEGEQPEAAQ